MKTKVIQIGLITVLCLGSYFLGSYGHHAIAPNTTLYGPDFASPMPFRAFTVDYCSPAVMPLPDEFSCVVKLSNATVVEANTLADKLLASPLDSQDDVLATIQKAQKSMNTFTEDVCDLEAIKYGGTGMRLEAEACRYYYTTQYLNILKSIEQKHLSYSLPSTGDTE